MPSTYAMSVGLAFSSLLALSLALPNTPGKPFSTVAPTGSGAYIWLSSVTPTIFGQTTTNFDYYLFSDAAPALEAVQDFAQAFDEGIEENIVTTFLNATLGGTLTAEHASDDARKCLELGEITASAVATCQGFTGDLTGRSADLAEQAVAKRSEYTWIQSGSHVPSTASVDALNSALEANPSYMFPSSPRSFCNTASNIQACFSWSSVQSFSYSTASGIINDALSVVNFNTESAQADGVLTSESPSADVCISNRASGCT